MQETKTMAQRIKDLLEPVPGDQFIVGQYTDPKQRKCCSIGHLCRLTSGDPDDYDRSLHAEMSYQVMAREMKLYIASYLQEKFDWKYANLAEVNDATNRYVQQNYPQATPKERVKALLNEMIAEGL